MQTRVLEASRQNAGLRVIVFDVALALALSVCCLLAGCNRVKPVVPDDFQEVVVEYVIDGDTINVIMDGQARRVRLIGVDAPESASHDPDLNVPEGVLATDFARNLMPEGSVVYLQGDETETDRYNRLLRYVWLELPADALNPDEVSSKMVNARIVEEGFALAKGYWPDLTYADLFDQAQQRAVNAGRGVSYLWA